MMNVVRRFWHRIFQRPAKAPEKIVKMTSDIPVSFGGGG